MAEILYKVQRTLMEELGDCIMVIREKGKGG